MKQRDRPIPTPASLLFPRDPRDPTAPMAATSQLPPPLPHPETHLTLRSGKGKRLAVPWENFQSIPPEEVRKEVEEEEISADVDTPAAVECEGGAKAG